MLPGMPESLPASPALSADRKRTVRQRQAIEWGSHPLAVALDGPLGLHPRQAEEGRRCGNCAFRELINRGNGAYPKCVVDRGPFSRTRAFPEAPPRYSAGAGTDVRKWWPGCPDHEFGDPTLDPDAARSGPAEAYADNQ